jgi:NAD(P)-dependent dehydrogenase (short-subunit alcohol dehydrogenase family)
VSADNLSTAALSELLDLSRQNAIVSGAGQGLGLAVAARLTEAGAGVLLVDLDADRVENAAGSLRNRGGRAIAAAGDVARPEDVARWVETAGAELGSVDLLINNAGIWPREPFLEASPELWSQTLQVNLIGGLLLSQAVAARMIDAGTAGAIVNVASIAGIVPHGDDLIAYGASKAAVINATRTLAKALAPSGIRVNVVLPGGIDTPGVQTTPRRQGSDIPLGHRADPDEIATAIVLLASPLARYITGAQLVVDGGATLV